MQHYRMSVQAHIYFTVTANDEAEATAKAKEFAALAVDGLSLLDQASPISGVDSFNVYADDDKEGQPVELELVDVEGAA